MKFDVAVIGLGAMGSAAAAHLAERGAKVIGFEAAFPAHAGGSSHGDSRIIRLGYFEDPAYVPLLRRAYENWRRLEQTLRQDILTLSGVLQIGRPDSDQIRGTLESCRLHNLQFELFDQPAASKRFPAFELDRDEVAVHDPEGGILRPEAAVFGHIRVAAANGAVLHFREKVTAIQSVDSGITVVSAAGTYQASKVVVATGSWIGQLVPQLAGIAQPIRQVLAWYQPRDSFNTKLGRMPAFIRDDGDNGSFFGVPSLDGGGVKIGRHTHFMEHVDPDRADDGVNDKDTALLDEFIARRLPLAAGVRINQTTCRYTMLPGENLLFDLLPSDNRIVVASPCSGHGFKFASVVGEILADLALDGGTALPVHPFSFASLPKQT